MYYFESRFTVRVQDWSVTQSTQRQLTKQHYGKQTRTVDDKIKYSIIEHFLLVKLKSVQYAPDSPAPGFLIISIGSLEVLRQIESSSLRVQPFANCTIL